MFTLYNPHGIPPTKYSLKKGKVSTQNDDEYGIWFGGGVEGNFEITMLFNKATSSTTFTSGFGPRSFEDTTGKGSRTFTGYDVLNPVDEIWVYVVQ